MPSRDSAGDPTGPIDPIDPAKLLPLVYDQLRKQAQIAMHGERRDHTLSATALVHEAYLKLAGPGGLEFAGRAHFYAAAADAMRKILIDHARAKHAEKRGGKKAGDRPAKRLLLTEIADFASCENPEEILALDEALLRLEQQDDQLAKVVKLRFFAGMSVEETAQAMEISQRTVKRHWQFARAWLYRELRRED